MPFAPANAEREARAREKKKRQAALTVQGSAGASPASGGAPGEVAPTPADTLEGEPQAGAERSTLPGFDGAGTPSSPSDSPPMGAAKFKAWREELGISREDAAKQAFLLFPDKSIPQLTDADRGVLRDALAESLTREAVKA